MPCKTWSQPDGNHIRGLCTNKLFAEGPLKNCVLCITPVDMSESTCGCADPLTVRAIHYLQIEYIGSPPTGNTCVVDDPIGDFVLVGNCGAKTPQDQITVNTLAPSGTPGCEGYAPAVAEESRVKKYQMDLVGTPYMSGGRRLQEITLTYNRRAATWTGPTPPIFTQQTPYVFDGAIPWCTDEQGSATLLQRGTTENPSHAGIFPPSVRAIISTEPFES